MFYKNKLKKPLAELRAASEKIANNDLDFSIDYDSNDELRQLCASFEIMRTTLAVSYTHLDVYKRQDDTESSFESSMEAIEKAVVLAEISTKG